MGSNDCDYPYHRLRQKSCMVQMHLMATINQETGNPSNALERQVQTLPAAVERLTQRNQELEQQLNQRNERRQEGPHDGRDVDE